MKKGKTSHIHGFNFAKVTYGTVDSVNLKSIYLNIQTWVEPIKECDNWTRTVLNMSRAIKHSVYESVNTDLFDNKFIVDLDLRSSGISEGKKSFMNLEINLFTKQDGDFKCNEIKDSVKKILKRVYKDNILNNNHFNFSSTKNSDLLQTIY